MQIKKSPHNEMTSLYQRMLTFMNCNAIFDTGCIGLQKVAFLSLGCISMQPFFFMQPIALGTHK